MSAARFALKALRTRFWDQRPFILSHLITARCNADCLTCLWKMPADARADELDTAEVRALYADAARAGFLELVLWGGEPMVRLDAGDALRTARQHGLSTTMITNGWFLADRADEVLPHTGRLLVSVDGVGALHDEVRRCPGLVARLDRGLHVARARFPGVRLVIVSVLSKLNAGALRAIAEYGRALSAQVVFQAMNVTDYGFADRALDLSRLELDPREESEVAASISALAREGYPVRDSGAYLSRLGARALEYRCHYKKVVLRVEPNGDVLDCTRSACRLWRAPESSLSALTRSDEHRLFVGRAEECNRCRDAGVIELSHIWEGRPEALVNAIAALR